MKKIFILSLLLFINLQLLFSQEIIQLLQQTQKSEENIPKDLYLPYTQISIVEINPLLWEERSIKLDDKISIDLFENDSYLATIDRISKNVNGTLSIRARLEDYKWGYLILSVTNDMVLAKVKIPEKNEQYSIKTNYFTKETYLKKIDIPNLDIIESGPDIIPPEIRNIDDDKIAYLKEIAKKKSDAPANVDVMIVYTPAAQTWGNNNDGSILNTVAQSMELAQLALDNSNTYMNMTLVHSSLINYTESGSGSTDLYRLTFHEDFDPWDYEGTPRYMEEVHEWREEHGADLVALFAHVNDVGGVGWLLRYQTGSHRFGFSLTRVQQAGNSYTHIHEMGHNMGCHHHKDQNVQPGPTSWHDWPGNTWSAGWRWLGSNSIMYCDLMTYSSGSYFSDGISATRIAYFSNPDITHMGQNAGHAVYGDNARTLREVRHVIADYMEAPAPPQYTVTFIIEDEDGGSISDATITLGDLTNPQGNYVFNNVHPGQYNYIVVAEGFEEGTGIIDVIDQDVSETVVMGFVEPETYTVTFIIEDEDGVTITNATITLGDETNPQGNYVFNDLIAGQYNFLVVAEGFEDESGVIDVVDQDINEIVVMILEEEPEPDTFTVTFIIEDEDGVTITNATITLGDETNPQGNYVFNNILAGQYNFLVVADGFEDESGVIDVVDQDVTETVIMVLEEELETYTVSFNLKNQNNQNIANAVIKLGDITNAVGQYDFDDVSSGTYNYEINASGYKKYSGLAFVESEDLTINVIMEDVGTLSDATANSGILIFPNPAGENVNIESDILIERFKVVNLSGQVMYEKEVNDFSVSINVSQYYEGIYFIQIQLQDKLYSKRFQVIRN